VTESKTAAMPGAPYKRWPNCDGAAFIPVYQRINQRARRLKGCGDWDEGLAT